jgi:hypothetical protein
VLPFESRALRAAGLLEMQRKIREDEPDKPSARITSLGDRASDLARTRRTSAVGLAKALRAELDWIVLKAIAKEPERRYPSPNELAQDLARQLVHEPVVAGPPGAGYRLRKLARRYRVQVIAAAVVFVALIAGGIGTFVQYLRAEANAAAEKSAKEGLARGPRAVRPRDRR